MTRRTCLHLSTSGPAIRDRNLTIGFNVETVEYKNISFTVWDVGGQDKVRTRKTPAADRPTTCMNGQPSVARLLRRVRGVFGGRKRSTRERGPPRAARPRAVLACVAA